MPKQDILIKTYPQNKNSCSMTRRSRLKKTQRKLRQKRVLPLRHHRSESKALANTLRRHYFGPFPQHPPLSKLFNFSNNHFYLKTLCSNAAVFGINSPAHSAVVSIYTQHTNLQASYTEGGN